jgi:hypothetical protein
MNGLVTGEDAGGRALWSRPHGNLLAATGPLWTDAAADAALEHVSHREVRRRARWWRAVCTHVSLALTCRAAFRVHQPLVRRTLTHLADLLNAVRHLLDAAAPDERTWMQWAWRAPRPEPDFLGLLHVLLSPVARWPRGTCSAVATFDRALTGDLEGLAVAGRHIHPLGMAWGNDAAYADWPPIPEQGYWALRSGNVRRYRKWRRRIYGHESLATMAMDVVLQAMHDDAPLVTIQAAYWMDEADFVPHLVALLAAAEHNRDPRVAAFVRARFETSPFSYDVPS